MQEGVFSLLADAGIRVAAGRRAYRPTVSLAGYEAKILKPQNIVEMVELGSRDMGFAGADWVAELGARVTEIFDTRLDPVRLVAAAPAGILVRGKLPHRPLVVASEYETLSRRWMRRRKLQGTFVRSYGATEVFPPEDADVIVDNTASGATLAANNLAIVDEVMASSTRLYANPRFLATRAGREAADRLTMLLASVLEARGRVMLEVNVSAERREAVVGALPCMREPTIAPLHGGAGYAVKAAVPREDLPRLIPEIKKRGGSDVVVTVLAQIVP